MVWRAYTKLKMNVSFKKACSYFVKQMDSIIMANECHIE